VIKPRPTVPRTTNETPKMTNQNRLPRRVSDLVAQFLAQHRDERTTFKIDAHRRDPHSRDRPGLGST
jgi:hypothetical protein